MVHGSKNLYSSLFRVTIGFLLLINQLYWIFYTSDFTLDNNLNFSYFPNSQTFNFILENAVAFHSIFSVVCVLFILGLFGNITSIIVAILLTIQYNMYFMAMDWGDGILQKTMLYFAFVNSFHYLSYPTKFTFGKTISSLGVLSILLHVMYIFVSNAMGKLINEDWLSGFAFWYFLRASENTNLLKSFFDSISNIYVIKLLTYTALIWQTLFMPIMFTKHLRLLWLLLGVAIHIMMALILQYYNFEITMILLFGFFLTDQEWMRLKFVRNLCILANSKK